MKINIYDYLDEFNDIEELRKAAKILLKQYGKWLDELRRENYQLSMMEEDAQKYALKRKQENEKLKNALEFYASASVWNDGTNPGVCPSMIYGEDIKWRDNAYRGGQIAIQALKKEKE